MAGDRADPAVAQSLASAGLTGLVGLPFLLIASVMLETPLAGPAAIALGYLASARALALSRPGRAAAWSAAVLAGLVAWTLLPFATGDAPATAPELSAVLLAPLFAAAPAFARVLLSTADTAAGTLDAAAEENGSDAAPTVAEAALKPAVAAGRSTLGDAASTEQQREAPPPACPIASELDFAIRTLAGRMRGRRLRLAVDVEPGLAAQCDRRACRRMLAVAVAAAIGKCPGDGEIRIEARRLRGVALIRVALATEEAPEAVWRAEAMAAVAELADQAGGTALLDGAPGEARLSIRLASAREAVAVRSRPVREAA
jgi:hypothetical protein